MRNWKLLLLSAAMTLSFTTDVYGAKFLNKIKSGVSKVKSSVKNKLSNKNAMNSKDAKRLKKAISPMAEYGGTIDGMKDLVKLVTNMIKKAGVPDEGFAEKVEAAAKKVKAHVKSMNFAKASGTLKEIFKDIYKSVQETMVVASDIKKTYEDNEDRDAEGVMRGKLSAIHKELGKIRDAMQDKLEPNNKRSEKLKSDEDDEDEED